MTRIFAKASVAFCLLVSSWSAQAQEPTTPQSTPAPTAASSSPAPAAAPTEPPALRIAIATTRIRALTAAIEFNALRLLLANPSNGPAIVEALSKTLNVLTQDQRPAAAASSTPAATAAPASIQQP